MLSALAGCVDAIGFLQLGGHFISFMSGNSTQLAVDLTKGNIASAANLAGIILLFVGGTVIGTLAGNYKKNPNHTATILAIVTMLAACAAICASMDMETATIMFMTVAMGMVNTVFQRNGEVIIGLTYMTGALVKVGQRIARSLAGEKNTDWMPHLLLWFGLITGGVMGAFLFQAMGLKSLFAVALWGAALTGMTCWKNPTCHEP